jgi:UDP-glucose 4-epimerase
VHKIYGEHLCKIYSELYGLRFVILRPSNVYGPGQPYWKEGWYNFISFWMKLALKGKPIPVYGTGEQIRDYLYVEDAAKAYNLALENERAIGETFLLATGRGVSLIDLANKVIQITGSKSGIRFLPARKGDIPRFVGDYGKAKSVLGWVPRTSLEEGLRLEADWVKSELRKKA